MHQISQIYASRESFGRRIALHFATEVNGAIYAFAQPLTFIKSEEGGLYCGDTPAMSLDMRAAQRLMDELWTCGLRPSEGTGSAGSLAATERHLADMQKIAFGLLRDEGVQ